ncbi:unnamed protein product, partial [Allacma fusca]
LRIITVSLKWTIHYLVPCAHVLRDKVSELFNGVDVIAGSCVASKSELRYYAWS